jgi:hypothetical protein
MKALQVGTLATDTQSWHAQIKASLQGLCSMIAAAGPVHDQETQTCSSLTAGQPALRLAETECMLLPSQPSVPTGRLHRMPALAAPDSKGSMMVSGQLPDESGATAAGPDQAGMRVSESGGRSTAAEAGCHPVLHTSSLSIATTESPTAASPSIGSQPPCDADELPQTPPFSSSTCDVRATPELRAAPLADQTAGVHCEGAVTASPLVSHFLTRWLPVGCWRLHERKLHPRSAALQLTSTVDVSPGRMLKCAAELYSQGAGQRLVQRLPVSVLVSPGRRVSRAYAIKAEPEVINLVWQLYCVRQLPVHPDSAQALHALTFASQPLARGSARCVPHVCDGLPVRIVQQARTQASTGTEAVLDSKTAWQWASGLRALWSNRLARSFSGSSGLSEDVLVPREQVSSWLPRVWLA